MRAIGRPFPKIADANCFEGTTDFPSTRQRMKKMNRAQRRALARRQGSVTRESHKLTPQLCTLWVPDARGYLAEFCPHSFRAVPFAELARHYLDDEATSAALAFQEVTGLRVVVRPYYGECGGSCIGCSDDVRSPSGDSSIESLLAA